MIKRLNEVNEIYKSRNDNNLNYLAPAFFIVVYVIIITGMYIKAELLESRTTWSKSMCIPKYMFVSGFIKKEPGRSSLETTYDNFKTCVKRFKTTPYNPNNMNMNLDVNKYNFIDKNWF